MPSRAARRAGELRSVGFAPLGGAYNRRGLGETAFRHRDQLFMMEHLAVVSPTAANDAKHAAREWIERSWTSVHDGASGYVYPCFPDPELDDWSRAYYGDNYPRLREVKARYDLDNVFRYQQSLEPLASSR
jgi:FAD/FMN-containing dehydrogenase